MWMREGVRRQREAKKNRSQRQHSDCHHCPPDSPPRLPHSLSLSLSAQLPAVDKCASAKAARTAWEAVCDLFPSSSLLLLRAALLLLLLVKKDTRSRDQGKEGRETEYREEITK